MGRTLGLTAFAPSASFSLGTSFKQLKRTLGVPAPPFDPSFQQWLYGVRRGLEVLVVNYETGSGSSSTTWTGAIARVDPPLFLGLGVSGHPWLELFGSPDIRVGHPYADDKLRIEGFDPARITELLAPHVPQGHEILARMVAAENGTSLGVSDSVVAISKSEVITDPGAILAMLDPAIDLAALLAARRAYLSPSPGELAQRAEWQRFAEVNRFAFDPLRMKLEGERGGSRMEVALETEGQHVRTAVTVRFPRPVGVAFTVRRTNTPSFLQGLFSQDIRVGEERFDELYKVTGYPEPAVRAALARPNLLALLVGIGQATPEVQLNHAELFFRFIGASPRAVDLEPLVELGHTTTRELFGEVRGIDPYR
jgi:hypothetical protein